jgi:hypothetical protein
MHLEDEHRYDPSQADDRDRLITRLRQEVVRLNNELLEMTRELIRSQSMRQEAIGLRERVRILGKVTRALIRSQS